MASATLAAEPEEPQQADEPAGGQGLMGGLDFAALLPERTADDILARVVRVRLGAHTYALPVLSIAANRRWKTALEDQLVGLFGAVESIEDEDLRGLLAAFSTVTDQLLDALERYDEQGVLPPRAELEEEASDIDVLLAVLGVWSAANPFVEVARDVVRDVAAAMSNPATPAAQPTSSSTRTSSSRPSTAGARRSSSRT